MKNKIFIILTIILFRFQADAQFIQWQKSFGGTDDESMNSVIRTRDGNFVLCGSAGSNDGDISNHFGFVGGNDFWLLKIDSVGNLLWNKCLGGSLNEAAYSVVETFDNNLLIVGSASSNDHEVMGLHGASSWGGFDDFWVVKTDSAGNILWQKCFGGTDLDDANSVEQTSDSGFVIIGNTSSNDGDVVGYHGYDDILVIRIDKNGNLLWSRAYGGTGDDAGFFCKQNPDGTFFIGGGSNSPDGDIVGNHSPFTSDAWIAKITASGQIIWSRCYGGSGVDGISNLFLSNDGGFYCIGTTSSNDGDILGFSGLSDFWFFKADSMGNIQWTQCYGGSGFDDCRMSYRTSEGDFVMTGFTSSNDGLVNNHKPGIYDFFVIKTDSLGGFQWSTCIGGSEDEFSYSLTESSPGKIVVCGQTESDDYDISLNHGGKDAWVVAIDDNTSDISAVNNSLSQLQARVNGNSWRVTFKANDSEKTTLLMTDVVGHKLFSQTITTHQGFNEYNFLVNSKPGILILSLLSDYGDVSQKICNFQ